MENVIQQEAVMGENRLIQGDCLEVMDEMIEDGIKVDLTVTSPPYDNLRTYKGSLIWNETIWKQVIKRLYDITVEGGVVVWVVGDATIKGSETLTSFKQAIYFQSIGFNVHDTMIYEKSGVMPSKVRYSQQFEYMFILSKGKPKAINLIKDRKNNWANTSTGNIGQRQPDGSIKKNGKKKIAEFGLRFNIWRIINEGGWLNKDILTKEHPATFPQNLANDHIISWSNEGDTVFDPFMGSGTTGKMALLNNREFIGIEKVSEYFEIAKNRIEKAMEGDMN